MIQDIFYVKYFLAEATKLNITSYSLEINEGKFTIILGSILSIKVIEFATLLMHAIFNANYIPRWCFST